MNFSKPTVVITGAGSGLGRGLSLSLAQSGYPIIVTDKDIGAAQETVSQLSNAKQCVAYELDVTSDSAVQRFAQDIANYQATVLINNAGLQHVAPLEDFPQEKWDLLLNVMLHGASE